MYQLLKFLGVIKCGLSDKTVKWSWTFWRLITEQHKKWETVVFEATASIAGRIFHFGINGFLHTSLKPSIIYVQSVNIIVLKKMSFFWKVLWCCFSCAEQSSRLKAGYLLHCRALNTTGCTGPHTLYCCVLRKHKIEWILTDKPLLFTFWTKNSIYTSLHIPPNSKSSSSGKFQFQKNWGRTSVWWIPNTTVSICFLHHNF